MKGSEKEKERKKFGIVNNCRGRDGKKGDTGNEIKIRAPLREVVIISKTKKNDKTRIC